MNPQQTPPPLPSQPQPSPAFGGPGGPLPTGQPAPIQPASPEPKQQVAEQLKSATNVLVTVSANPSVDQLTAAIGLTLVLNRMGKHATAVFSGKTPSTIQFLQPEKTLEKNTDSLQDFIIALDKAKADKLRYKVEDKFVKIFITPYKTSLSEKDLEFSLGDFNVDVVVALGVKRQQELDQAIVAHGRILHDATVISVNHQAGADLGAINWNEPKASSLCEILVDLCDLLKTPNKSELLDQQNATAFLTGIVAETNRFSNNNTTPQTMSISARLMRAGANQQLIATKLEPPKPPQRPLPPPPPPKKPDTPPPPTPIAGPPPPPKPTDDGSLKIPHYEDLDDEDTEEPEEDDIDKIHIDDQGTLRRLEEMRTLRDEELAKQKEEVGRQILGTPSGSAPKLTANTEPEALDPSTDALSLPAVKSPLLDHDTPSTTDDETLTAIEKSVHSSHLNPPAVPMEPSDTPPPITDIKPSGSLLLPSEQNEESTGTVEDRSAFPSQLVKPDGGLPPEMTAGSESPSAPPVPPPIIPSTYMPPSNQDNLSDPNSGIPL